MARNEWENDDSDFLRALHSVCKKIRTIFFHTLLAMHRPVVSYKHFKKLVSAIWKHWSLGFLKILYISIIPLIHARWKSLERAWILWLWTLRPQILLPLPGPLSGWFNIYHATSTFSFPLSDLTLDGNP